jgi:hypothetical protein
MAILMSLGFRGDTHPRTFQSSFAQLLAAIRSAAFNMTVAINAPFTVNGRKSLLDDHGEPSRDFYLKWKGMLTAREQRLSTFWLR